MNGTPTTWTLQVTVVGPSEADYLDVQDDIESALSEAFEAPEYQSAGYEVVSVEAQVVPG